MRNKDNRKDRFDELPIYIYPEDYEQQLEMGGKPTPVVITALVDLGQITMIYRNSEGMTYFAIQGDSTSTPLTISELRERIARYNLSRDAVINFNGFKWEEGNEQ